MARSKGRWFDPQAGGNAATSECLYIPRRPVHSERDWNHRTNQGMVMNSSKWCREEFLNKDKCTLVRLVPHVRIQGSPDIHVNQGSVINLTCIISYSPEAPAFIFWYHGDQVVPYDSERGRISVTTEPLGRETRSHLVIHDASPSRDSGNYTCKPSIAKAASIKVHVLENVRAFDETSWTNDSISSIGATRTDGEQVQKFKSTIGRVGSRGGITGLGDASSPKIQGQDS
eukprot:snap_masked-scaffold55_size446313-processed-gene-3.2 protein:Tk00238 transcript:snap_masked-scaffold55_size446313-processed-gene-3.2-mRNA-1 annotation:"hypothetical protein KGM_11578"